MNLAELKTLLKDLRDAQFASTNATARLQTVTLEILEWASKCVCEGALPVLQSQREQDLDDIAATYCKILIESDYSDLDKITREPDAYLRVAGRRFALKFFETQGRANAAEEYEEPAVSVADCKDFEDQGTTNQTIGVVDWKVVVIQAKVIRSITSDEAAALFLAEQRVPQNRQQRRIARDAGISDTKRAKYSREIRAAIKRVAKADKDGQVQDGDR